MRSIQAKNYEDLSRKAANIISAQILLHPRSVLGLATGSTPIGTYKRLIELCAAGDADFSQVHTVNLDEYCGLPKDSAQSYYRFMAENLFSHVNIDPANTHIPNGMASDMQAECSRYDALIEALGGIDLQLLGIGLNGHIGFNEPGDTFKQGTHCVVLESSTRQANARFFSREEDVPAMAVTMGMREIMQAKSVLLIASGKEKQDILQKALYGPVSPAVPASILQMHPHVTVIYCE